MLFCFQNATKPENLQKTSALLQIRFEMFDSLKFLHNLGWGCILRRTLYETDDSVEDGKIGGDWRDVFFQFGMLFQQELDLIGRLLADQRSVSKSLLI